MVCGPGLAWPNAIEQNRTTVDTIENLTASPFKSRACAANTGHARILDKAREASLNRQGEKAANHDFVICRVQFWL
jgi:hypothetical protein